MKVGIAADHGGFELNRFLVGRLKEADTRFSISGRRAMMRMTIIPIGSCLLPGHSPAARSRGE